MDKIKIGIPRSMYFYYYGNILKNFFENLDFEVIISPKTNKEIMDLGIKYAYDEMCMSLKNYIGHIAYLKDICDYIVIPRIDNYGYNDQTCTNFLSLYDIINNLFNVKILNYNINLVKKQDELNGFIEMAKTLKINSIRAKEAYSKAKIDDMNKEFSIERNTLRKLESKDIKILVVGHPYNTKDDYIGKPITKMLEKEGATIIYSDEFNKEKANKLSKKLSRNLYFKYNKENIGSIMLSKDKIDGILFLTTFPCGPDSLANELVMRKLNMPYLNIIIDDLDSIVGFETRIESFMDIVKERRQTCEK